MKLPVHFGGELLVAATFCEKPLLNLMTLSLLTTLIIAFSAHTARAQTFDTHDLNRPEPYTNIEEESHVKPWLLASAAEAATIFLISQTKNGPLIFGTAYAAGTLFLMRETFYQHDEDIGDLIVPLGLLSMSVLNFALLNNDNQYSYANIFGYNIVGAGLLTAYAWWEDSQRLRSGRRRVYSILPFIKESHTGLAWTLRF